MDLEHILETLKRKTTPFDLITGGTDIDDLSLGKIEIVDEYGGMGQGDDYWKVYHFLDYNIYLKVEGYYQSYDGIYIDGWSSCYRVFPKEKVITVYEETDI